MRTRHARKMLSSPVTTCAELAHSRAVGVLSFLRVGGPRGSLILEV